MRSMSKPLRLPSGFLDSKGANSALVATRNTFSLLGAEAPEALASAGCEACWVLPELPQPLRAMAEQARAVASHFFMFIVWFSWIGLDIN